MVPGKQSNCDGNPQGDLGILVDVRTLFCGLWCSVLNCYCLWYSQVA